MKERVYLYDLPTYPKGVLSLSLPAVAGCLKVYGFEVHINDLNFYAAGEYNLVVSEADSPAMFGLKVSAQNWEYAVSITKLLKERFAQVPVVWGGELPTLQPDVCLQYADSIIQSMFEPVAEEFVNDLRNYTLRSVYAGTNEAPISGLPLPHFGALKNRERYYSFMGMPLETSRGCSETCSFCMVHVMQKKHYHVKSAVQLSKELQACDGRFVNVVDYNIGVDKHHVLAVAKAIGNSKATGWMGEMCIEMLDDDEVLSALRHSGCRMIYCGLESIDESALRSVHKMNTNHIENYERIIRKAQSYGVQVAAGIILGMDGTHEKTFDNLYAFFQRMGIVYAKLTFLTYNPGAKVQQYMKKKGVFTTDTLSAYDGNHLSYIPNGVKAELVYAGATDFINRFYSLKTIVARSLNTRLTLARRIEFILFNLCYRQVYTQWIKHDIFENEAGFKYLLEQPFKKTATIKLAEKVLCLLRKV